jgi:hypothetical protein
MRLRLLTAAVAASALTAPAYAQTGATGYVGAAYNDAEASTPLGDIETDGFGIEGALALAPGGGTLGFDLNADYTDSDDSDSTSSLTGHVYAKGANGKFGGFVGIADVSDETVWSVGVEGQHNFTPMFTGAGALAYASADDSDADLFGADGEGRLFLSDNARLDLKLGYVDIDSALGDDSALSVGAGGEFQFASAPISLFGGYRHTEFDDSDVDVDAFTIGARWNFGGSLRERNDSGPSFGGLSTVASGLRS